MKGFKNTTKTISGHHFASGGIVPKLGGVPGMRAGQAVRPILPRPHVMPSGGGAKAHFVKLAKGGRFGEGNSLELPNPYSEIESEHPRKAARPGYAKGGKPKVKKGALHRDMGIPQGKPIPTGAIKSKLHRDKASGNSKGVKRDVFALNNRGAKFAKGGQVGCDEDAMESVADQAVARHVATKPPQGHGVKPKGGLGAFNRTPLCGGGRT